MTGEKLTGLSTAEWMEQYCGGDAAAFRKLYDHAAPRLLNYLHQMIGDRVTAEDLLQQTFVKVHQSRSAYVKGADPMPWLYTIAHRTALDELRRRGRTTRGKRGLQADPTGRVGGSPAPAPNGSDRNGERERNALREAALEALQKLPPSQRQALVLTKLEGLSVAQAAEAAGTTRTAIKLRAHRAYRTLRVLLSKLKEKQ